MYNLPYFKAEDQHEILAFLQAHPFIFLTGSFQNGRQVVTQIPILVEVKEDKIILHGHIMRHTDHHQAFIENNQVLAVATGPNAYVSATWYTNPQIGSTWNYMSVHMQGTISLKGEEELKQLMRKLTLHFEDYNTASATYYDNLPDTFLKPMMQAIVAFEIEVSSLENVFKLSQNRDEASYLRIIDELEKRGGEAAMVAMEMKLRKEKLFPIGKEWDSNKFIS
jgi:transcriptional regulator